MNRRSPIPGHGTCGRPSSAPPTWWRRPCRDYRPVPEWFSEGTLADLAILDLSSRIELVPDLRAGKRTRGSYSAPAEAEVHARGRIYRNRVDVPRGEAARPLSAKGRAAKFLRLAATRLPEKRAVALWHQLGRLDRVRSVRALAEAMAGS